MLTYPDIHPVAVSIGPVNIYWYGLMYLLGFLAAWCLGRIRARKPWCIWQPEQIADMVFYTAVGIIIGGRLGYVLFYDAAAVLEHPWRVLAIWQGGMSFHGGLLGAVSGMALFAYQRGKSLFQVTDFIAPLVPIGLGLGRLGNFINGELWGRPTDMPWGMVFAHVDSQARHPSMLYEMVLEGPILFAILWVYSAKPRPTMAVSAWFLILYGVFRFIVEFFREPDAHLGFIALGWLTMGQLLSLPMIFVGILLLVLVRWRRCKRI